MAYAHPFLASDQWKACLSRIVLNGTRDRILEEMETIQNILWQTNITNWKITIYSEFSYMSNRQNSRILKYVLAGHWFSESAKN
jgi:hypothetical protein